MSDLEVFRTVATSASFTEAAARLRLDKARVSRIISSLEAELKLPLLIRSTRSMRLTVDGSTLLHRITEPLDALRAATEVVDSDEGEVTLATTPEIARALLPAALTSFRLRFAKTRVVLRTSSALEELTQVDLALRIGRRAPGAWVAVKLRALHSGFFASPSYLERRGAPRRPEELAHHEGLWPIPPKGTKSFSPQGLKPSAPSIASSDFQVLASLALAGAGIALLPTFLVEAELAAARLIRVLPSVTLGEAPLMLLSRPPTKLTSRAKALRAHLRATLSDP